MRRFLLLFFTTLALVLPLTMEAAIAPANSGSLDPLVNQVLQLTGSGSGDSQTTGQAGCGNPSINFVPIVCLPFLVKYDSIGTLLAGAFRLAIVFGSIAAVGMLVVGGFQYMAQDAISSQKQAREKIQGAVFGLILLLLSYLVLFVINPDIIQSVDCFEARMTGKSTAACKVRPLPGSGTTLPKSPLQAPYCQTNCTVEREQCESIGGTFISAQENGGRYSYVCNNVGTNTVPQNATLFLTCKESGCTAEKDSCTNRGGSILGTTVSGSSTFLMCSK